MGANPKEILDRQLELLKIQSDKGSLTFEECQSLERIVRMQLLLRMKGNQKPLEDSFEDLSSEELQKLLPLLSE